MTGPNPCPRRRVEEMDTVSPLAKFPRFRYDTYMDATVYESNCASLWACTFLF